MAATTLAHYSVPQVFVKKKISPELLERLIKAGEIIHAQLEVLPKEIAKAYASHFQILIDIIDKNKPNGRK